MTKVFCSSARLRALCLLCLLIMLFGPWAARSEGLDEKLKLCISCHGEGAPPTEGYIPIIAGQEFYYLYVQLKDYKAGRRQNQFMSDIVADLEKDDMKALAEHFSKKSWPSTGFRTDETDVARAKSAAASGMCSQCHLGSYQGDSRVPRLAGQQVEYLKTTMLEFKNKHRLNSPSKGSLLAAYDDADIAALARYIGGLQLRTGKSH